MTQEVSSADSSTEVCAARSIHLQTFWQYVVEASFVKKKHYILWQLFICVQDMLKRP